MRTRGVGAAAWLLGLLVQLGCGAGTAPTRAAPTAVEFPVVEGLAAEHVGVRPLVEWVHCDLPRAPCQGRRVYPDGTVYLGQGEAGPYARLTTLRPGGVPAVTAQLACACASDDVMRPDPSSHGRSVYRIATPDCSREVTLYGVQAGPYGCLRELEATVNGQLVPVAP